MDMYTLLYLKWATNQPSLFFTLSAGNSAQSYVAAWMGVEFGGGEWIHVYAWLSSFSVHLQMGQKISLRQIFKII